jgi:hypothetical protein
MSNLPEVIAAWENHERKFDIALAQAAVEISLRLEAMAKSNIKGRRPEGQKATSGQPPMNRTGNLRRSIAGTTSRRGFGSYAAVVGAYMDYARAVEIGAPYNPPSWQNGEHFPFIQPAVDKFKSTSLFTRIVRKHLGAI